MLLLLPRDPLRTRRPDPAYAAEADAARDAGVTVALVDHDLLARGGDPAGAVRGVPADDDAVYRGWMVRSEAYAELATALAVRDVTLRTSAGDYRRAHELPGWVGAFGDLTPATVWTTGFDLADFADACRSLGPGPAMLRDHVKSMKHFWTEAAFIPDLADAARAEAVAGRFLELREEEATGGFVLRRFEELTRPEVRTWWVDGRCVHVGAHPDEPGSGDVPEPDLARVAPVIEDLALPFVTVDLARRTDGAWRVVELGDGQVSDRGSWDPAALVGALHRGDSR